MRVLVALVVAVVVLGAAPPAAGEDGWVWPVEGRVLTLYSNDNARPYAGGMHRGIDIAASVGTGVVAARAGTVTHAGVVGSSGLTVAVRTADGRHVTSYLHLAATTVRKGEAVAAGARIGAVGTSGRRSMEEPHLHFGVRLAEPADHYVDPLSLLPALAAPPVPVPPVPGPVPVRAAPAPAPVPAAPPLRASPRRAPLPRPVRPRPRGTLQPGPAVVPGRVRAHAPVRAGHALSPDRVPAGPIPRRLPATAPARAPDQVASPSRSSGSGSEVVFAGLGLIALVLFGGLTWRALARANAGVNSHAAAVVASIRDRARIGPALRRLLSPLGFM